MDVMRPSYIRFVKNKRLTNNSNIRKTPIPSNTIHQSIKLSPPTSFTGQQRKSISVLQGGRKKPSRSLVTKHSHISAHDRAPPQPIYNSVIQHSNRTQSTVKNYPMAQNGRSGGNVRYHKRVKSEDVYASGNWRQEEQKLLEETKGGYVNSACLSEVRRESLASEYEVQESTKANVTNIIVINGNMCKMNISTLGNSKPNVVYQKSVRPVVRPDSKSVCKQPLQKLMPTKQNIARFRQQFFSAKRAQDTNRIYKKDAESNITAIHKRSVSETQSNLDRLKNIEAYNTKNLSGRRSILKNPILKGKKAQVNANANSANPVTRFASEDYSHNSLNCYNTLNHETNTGNDLCSNSISTITRLNKNNISLDYARKTIESILRPKPDPRREKEMAETSQWIKDHWKENARAPSTTLKLYKIGKVLGKGAFGKVSLGIHKLTGKLVAVKSIRKLFMKDESSKNKVLKEVALWEQLSHPSIIR
eukprot:TRINITY_DN3359_c0_g2_i2.p1 TRINITY_DN3359_c0_g2~~TRINITY_DN3359_c0_g2_i2.p1  ORF type:complete len:476 (-),score=83.33 TRINITY_DN3359_c0_g2_i2:832-2259(-)